MKLFCIGDSLTYGYGVSWDETWTAILSRNTGIQIQNEGVCGDTSAGMLYRLEQISLEDMGAGFVMGGSNDILLDEPAVCTRKHMQSMTTLLVKTSKPVYVGIPPLTKEESAFYGWQAAGDVRRHNQALADYRQWLLALCREKGCRVIDFYEALHCAEMQQQVSLYADGVHPNAAGYAVLAAAAMKIIIH